MLNSVGDLIDLVKVVNPAGLPDLSKMTHYELLQYVNFRGHCSALVKVSSKCCIYLSLYAEHCFHLLSCWLVPIIILNFQVTGAYENLFVSHSSWFTYSATSRIYKIYDFNVDDPATGAKRLAFSSYPGELWLGDLYHTLYTCPLINRCIDITVWPPPPQIQFFRISGVLRWLLSTGQ